MDDTNLGNYFPAIAAVLALVANIFSAIGAARSADKAGQAEERMRTAEKAAAFRELRRAVAQLDVEIGTTAELVDAAIKSRKEIAMLAGGSGGSRQLVDVEDLTAVRDQIGHLSKLGELDVGSLTTDEVALRQIEVDEALIVVRAQKEAVLRKLAEYQREREIFLLRPNPGWDR